MCECAPFFAQCENDELKDKLIECAVHRLKFASTKLYQSIPIIGRMITDYHCPDFRIKGCVTQE